MSRDDPDAVPKGPLSAAAAIVERVVIGAVALALIVLAFFFLAAALVAGAILAASVVARLWWLRRKIRKAEEARYVSAEYEVIERERPPKTRLPPGP